MMTASIASSRVMSISIVASDAPRTLTRCQPGASAPRGRVTGGGVMPFTRSAANDDAWKMSAMRGALREERR